ncbi:MAG: hypothetical protein PVJ01_03815 [Pseudomonadota bacterium]|jgi:hypothetical protein
MNAAKNDQKVSKKIAKAAAKAAKKGLHPPAGTASPELVEAGKTPAERSADAAEKQLKVHKWRLIFAVFSVLVALGSLLVLLYRN